MKLTETDNKIAIEFEDKDSENKRKKIKTQIRNLYNILIEGEEE